MLASRRVARRDRSEIGRCGPRRGRPRLGARHGNSLIFATIPYLQRLAKLIVGPGQAVQVNWALLDFAATVCRGRAPLCHHRPLSDTCADLAVRRSAMCL